MDQMNPGEGSWEIRREEIKERKDGDTRIRFTRRVLYEEEEREVPMVAVDVGALTGTPGRKRATDEVSACTNVELEPTAQAHRKNISGGYLL